MHATAILALHHKGGSAWLHATFQSIGKRLNVPYRRIDGDEELSADDRAPPVIISFLNANAQKRGWMFEDPSCKILHMIRDPRDIIISGMHYHLKSTEAQLHIPRKDFGGLTYQQKLNSLDTVKERYLFELANSPGVKQMKIWGHPRPNCFECKYEDLIQDTEMNLFSQIASYLGFLPDELPECRRIFWNNSLFGGKADEKARGTSLHLRSGEARQWQSVFDQELGTAFVQTFGDMLIRFGYEPDNSWVSRLAPKAS
jgi:hypothetical protein